MECRLDDTEAFDVVLLAECSFRGERGIGFAMGFGKFLGSDRVLALDNFLQYDVDLGL